jgi:hypothetical protein
MICGGSELHDVIHGAPESLIGARIASKAKSHDMIRPEALDERLRFAIANKRLVQVTYHGHFRIGEPHDYGRQHHTPKVLFYQLRELGGSRRGDSKGWRLFDVSKIEECLVLPDTFRGSRGESHRRHLSWDELFARVA